MAWYTECPTMVTFCKESYSDLSEVTIALKECKDIIDKIKREIIVYAVSRCEDFKHEDGSSFNPLDVEEQILDLLDELQITEWRKTRLEALQDNFDCVLGDFVKNPNAKENIDKWIEKEIKPWLNE